MPLDPRSWRGKPVAVLGGTGFLGWHISRHLLDRGALVRLLGLPPPAGHPAMSLAAEQLSFGDVRDKEWLKQSLAGCPVVFNAAGPVAASASGLRRVHAAAIRNLLEAAEPDARIIHTSSVVAIGANRQPLDLDEDSPFPPVARSIDYVRAKRDAEGDALRAAGGGRDLVVVNPAYLVGPEDFGPSYIGRMCLRYWRGMLPVIPPGGLNLVDVRDVALGHLLAAERGQAGRRYILGGQNRHLSEFYADLAAAAGQKAPPFPRIPAWLLTPLAAFTEMSARLRGGVPFPSLQDARGTTLYWFYRSNRSQNELGFSPRPLPQTLADTFHWFRERRRRILSPIWFRGHAEMKEKP
jgi:dihydroflavonol-4-reductase